MRLFEVTDKSGRTIYITRERWSHIASEHPAIADKVEEIKESLTSPLTIRESNNDPNVRLYYRYYKNIKLKEKYLLVVAKYLNGEGFIITSYYVNKIKRQK